MTTNLETQECRRLPVIVHAVQWDGTVASATKIIDWVLAGEHSARWHPAVNAEAGPAHIVVDTRHGCERVYPSDWVVRYWTGRFEAWAALDFEAHFDVPGEP